MHTIRHYFWFVFWIGVFIVGYLWSSASGEARFNDPTVWHTSVELRRRTFEGPYSPSAFAWKALPSPNLAAGRA